MGLACDLDSGGSSVGVVAAAAFAVLRCVKNCLMSVCFLLKSKYFSVVLWSKNFADSLAAFFRALAAFFLCRCSSCLFSFATCCSFCLSAVLPVRNTCISLLLVTFVFALGILQLAWKEKLLRGGAGFFAAFSSFRCCFTFSIDLIHAVAFDSAFSLYTARFQASLSLASATSSAQPSSVSTSISISPACRYACTCLIAFFTRRSSCTSIFLPVAERFQRLSSRRNMWPSHLCLRARIHFSKLKVHVASEASYFRWLPVICDTI